MTGAQLADLVAEPEDLEVIVERQLDDVVQLHARDRDDPGTVYLLHFLEPIGNPDNPKAMAQHYIGWTSDLAERIADHTANLEPLPGTGRVAKIVAYVQRQGIGFKVARTWTGDRTLERRLKNRRNAPKLCPFCNPPKEGR